MYANSSFMSVSKKTSRRQNSTMSSISVSSDSSMSVRSGSTVQSPNTYSFDPPITTLQRQNSIPLDYAPPPPIPLSRTPEYRNQQDLIPLRQQLSIEYEHSRDPRSRKSGPNILRRRNLILLSIVSLSLSILSSMLIAFLYFNKELSHGDVKASSIQETCLECAALNFINADAELFQKLLKKQKDGTELCCARTSGQMSALIQLMIASNSNITLSANHNMKQFLFSPVSAHVSFQEPDSPIANMFEKSSLKLS
ncbi:uncharacterized protein LOC131929729 isoform X2 [Physella acuta]|nr:uncharacterized protein LOC131929729 isoform X2 [Physella acuta]